MAYKVKEIDSNLISIDRVNVCYSKKFIAQSTMISATVFCYNCIIWPRGNPEDVILITCCIIGRFEEGKMFDDIDIAHSRISRGWSAFQTM